MIEKHFPKIKNVIDEFEDDNKILRADREIILLYPRIFTLLVVSTYEQKIKENCGNIVKAPSVPMQQFPCLQKFVRDNPNNYVNKMYSKIESYMNADGNDVLNATNFYNLFGGTLFSSKLNDYYDELKKSEVAEYKNHIDSLWGAIGNDDRIDNIYLQLDEIYQRLLSSNFRKSERAFLLLRKKRNLIAHDFLVQFLDSFSDICALFYDSSLYVVALNKALSDLSTEK